MYNDLKKLAAYRKSYQAGLLQSKAFRILKRTTNEALAPYNLNATDWGILGLLVENKKGLTLKEIALEVGVKSPFVTRSVKQLADKKYLILQINQLDARIKIAQITKTGLVFVDKTEKVVMKHVLKTFSGVGKRNVIGYLSTLASIVKQHDDNLIRNVDLDHLDDHV